MVLMVITHVSWGYTQQLIFYGHPPFLDSALEEKMCRAQAAFEEREASLVNEASALRFEIENQKEKVRAAPGLPLLASPFPISVVACFAAHSTYCVSSSPCCFSELRLVLSISHFTFPSSRFSSVPCSFFFPCIWLSSLWPPW